MINSSLFSGTPYYNLPSYENAYFLGLNLLGEKAFLEKGSEKRFLLRNKNVVFESESKSDLLFLRAEHNEESTQFKVHYQVLVQNCLNWCLEDKLTVDYLRLVFYIFYQKEFENKSFTGKLADLFSPNLEKRFRLFSVDVLNHRQRLFTEFLLTGKPLKTANEKNVLSFWLSGKSSLLSKSLDASSVEDGSELKRLASNCLTKFMFNQFLNSRFLSFLLSQELFFDWQNRVIAKDYAETFKTDIVEISLFNPDLSNAISIPSNQRTIFADCFPKQETTPYAFQLKLKSLQSVVSRFHEKQKQPLFSDFVFSKTSRKEDYLHDKSVEELSKKLFNHTSIKVFDFSFFENEEVKQCAIDLFSILATNKQPIVLFEDYSLSQEENKKKNALTQEVFESLRKSVTGLSFSSIELSVFKSTLKGRAYLFNFDLKHTQFSEQFFLTAFPQSFSKVMPKSKKEDSVLSFEKEFEQFLKNAQSYDLPDLYKNIPLDSSRIDYQPLSNLGSSSGKVSAKIAVEIYQALKAVEKQYGSIDFFVAEQLGVEKDSLPQRLTCEQIDAVALSLHSMKEGRGLVLSDETGFGKGRILASVVIAGLNLGKSVFFFTENKQLFSDFFRDICAVCPEDKLNDYLPILFNSDAKIFDQQGNVVIDSYKTVKGEDEFKKFIKEGDWREDRAFFLMTNYAQVNQKNTASKPNAKLACLKRLQSNRENWIVLDEAHNASGNSNIHDNLLSLCKNAEGVLFSSATYAKTEQKLKLYEKALSLHKVAKNVLSLAMFDDAIEVREAVTKEMARKGHFIRREHPPVPLPQYHFLKNDELTQQQISVFSSLFQKIYQLIECREKLLGSNSAKVWLTLGSILSRANREYQMLMCLDELSQWATELVNQGKKVVITTSLTFEASMRALLEGESLLDLEDSEEESETLAENNDKVDGKVLLLDEKPLWADKFNELINNLSNWDLFVQYGFDLLKKRELEQFNPHQLKDEFENKISSLKEDALELVLKMPKFSVSPLDDLKNKLNSNNVSNFELSGRKHQLIKSGSGWEVNARLNLGSRVENVRKFNSGEFDVAILTLAGSTGISLHAGQQFKDQKQRHLIEWDIASNSASRLQFLGRVRRRDQVCEPEFSSILPKTLTSVRKVEIEKRKQDKLAAHAGGKKHSENLDWISEEGDLIIEEWAKQYPDVAKQIGGYYFDKEQPLKRIDKVLSRSVLLPLEYTQDLFSRMENGISFHESFAMFKARQKLTSKLVFKHFYWGSQNSQLDSVNGISLLNTSAIYLASRIWQKERLFPLDKITAFQEEVFQTIQSSLNKATLFVQDKEGSEGHSFIEKSFSELAVDRVLGLYKSHYHFIEMNKSFLFKEGMNNKAFYAQREWVWNNLKHLKIGEMFRVAIDGSYYKTGVIVDYIDFSGKSLLDYPDLYEESHILKSLNQVGLKVAFEDEVGFVSIPFYTVYQLFRKKQLTLTGRAFNTQSFQAIPKRFLTLTLEGNPVLLSVWRKMFDLGVVKTILDVEEGAKTLLALPLNMKYEDVLNLPSPFINHQQTLNVVANSYSFLRPTNKQPDCVIVNHVVKDKATLRLDFANKKLFVFFKTSKDYTNAHADWLKKAHHFVDEKINLRAKTISKEQGVFNESHVVIFKIGCATRVLELLKQSNFFFYCPSSEKEVYQKTLEDIFDD